MAPEQALKQEARWFANALRQTPPLDVTVDMVLGRLALYTPRFTTQGRVPQTHYQCPKCWVKDGVRSALRSVPGGEDYDVLRCNDDRCGTEFVIPF